MLRIHNAPLTSSSISKCPCGLPLPDRHWQDLGVTAKSQLVRLRQKNPSCLHRVVNDVSGACSRATAYLYDSTKSAAKRHPLSRKTAKTRGAPDRLLSWEIPASPRGTKQEQFASLPGGGDNSLPPGCPDFKESIHLQGLLFTRRVVRRRGKGALRESRPLRGPSRAARGRIAWKFQPGCFPPTRWTQPWRSGCKGSQMVSSSHFLG